MSTTVTRTRERAHVEDGRKRIRVYLGGELVADSTRTKLVWEKPSYPTYYFPEEDVRAELVPAERSEHSFRRGEARFFTVRAGGKEVQEAAYAYPESPIEELRRLVAFRWRAMDAWLEEDEEVFVHARDPYTRVDILPSSRRVQVVVNGVTVADSTRPTLLFETGLPTRYYFDEADVDMTLLTPSEKVTKCPYKGTASYWSVEAGGESFEDIAWTYREPLHESARIRGLIAFYDEKVDVIVDGLPQERPRTAFS